MKHTLTILLILMNLQAAAQEIAGMVLNEKKQPVVSVPVQVLQGGILKGGDATDIDGRYLVKPLDPGFYDLLFLYAGYDSVLIKNVVVTPGERTAQNCHLTLSTGQPKQIIKEYKKPLIDRDKVIRDHGYDPGPILGTSVTDLVARAPGVYQKHKPSLRPDTSASRNSGIMVGIDGVSVQFPDLPIINTFSETDPKPAIDYPTTFILTREDILIMRPLDTYDMLTILPGVYQPRRGDDVSIYGARPGGNLYIEDGMRLLQQDVR